ncbi:hypothetical protein BTUL_0047g00680 [Botrytis tulipae]|uniref:Uncharacterized protein n=1 Tax=Botrytis tulipae TaxID=87230 RepID=A0A4Z1ERK3_9HELO|nr:hypothetical protein BTUL_0047g00680 [Botrytis tulipae]
MTSKHILAAIEIGDNVTGMKQHIEDAIHSVWKIEENNPLKDMRCELFVLNCIKEMDEQGILTLVDGIDPLVAEVKELGLLSDPALNADARPAVIWKSKKVY